ncbi:MAG: hypothetical protein AAF567_24420 [Actinomycetota bacterium]
MTVDRAQTDTKKCGYPTNRKTPCQNDIGIDEEACSRHNAAAEKDRHEKMARFLAEFDGTWGDAEAAAQRAGVSRSIVYLWRDRYPEFRADWDLLRVENARAYKEVLAERFFVGTREPVIHQGRITGWYRKVDNRIGMFMLKALDPAYSDRASVSVSLERDGDAEAGFAGVFAAGGFAALQEAIDGVLEGEIVEDDP